MRALIIAAISIIAGMLIVRLVGSIQWSAVGDALRHLTWTEAAVLVALLVIRQVFNAAPIARFTPGLGRGRAMINDLSANLLGTITPPPGDVVIRVAQFRTWGIHPVDGMAGVTLTSVVFYGARFIAPVLGLLLLALSEVEHGHVILGLASGAIAAAIITALVLVLRSDEGAARVGRAGARLATAARASVDADAWIEAVVDFRRRISAVLRRQLLPALAGMLAAILVDGTIVLVSVRAVGVDAATLPWVEVFTAFLMVYPLTILPLFGLGVLDALLIAAWVDHAGVEFEATFLAATIVWRAITLGGTLILGVAAVVWWKWTSKRLPLADTS